MSDGPAPPRLAPVDDGEADPRLQLVFERARTRYGWLPNTIRVMARGNVTAHLYLEAGELNQRGAIAERERELLAVLTAAHNGCDYCRLAHSLAAGAPWASPALRSRRPARPGRPSLGRRPC